MAKPYGTQLPNTSGPAIVQANTDVSSLGPIRQMYAGTVTLASGTATITLPRGAAFDSATSYVVMIEQNSATTVDEETTVTTQTTNSFVIVSSNNSSTATLAWFAVGF